MAGGTKAVSLTKFADLMGLWVQVPSELSQGSLHQSCQSGYFHQSASFSQSALGVSFDFFRFLRGVLGFFRGWVNSSGNSGRSSCSFLLPLGAITINSVTKEPRANAKTATIVRAWTSAGLMARGGGMEGYLPEVSIIKRIGIRVE